MSVFGRFIESGSLRQQSRLALAVIQAASPTASDKRLTECCRSGVCCWRRPGALAADDVPRIAAHLGVTEAELFAQCLVVDGWGDEEMLLPRRAHQTGGRMIGWRETYDTDSPCVFLDQENDNACRIHEVKPWSCRAFKCWEGNGPDSPTMTTEELARLGWDGFNPDDYDDDCDE